MTSKTAQAGARTGRLASIALGSCLIISAAFLFLVGITTQLDGISSAGYPAIVALIGRFWKRALTVSAAITTTLVLMMMAIKTDRHLPVGLLWENGALVIASIWAVALTMRSWIALESRLQQAIRARADDQLARGLAHDFSNVLGAIVGFASAIAQDAVTDSENWEFAQRILTASKKGKEIVERLVTLGETRQSASSGLVDPGLPMIDADLSALTTRVESGRILIVDDEAYMVDILSMALERLGYATITVQDPLIALAAIKEDPSAFDALIADHQMPQMLGIDLLRGAKRLAPALRTILCTGSVTRAIETEAISAGVNAVIYKPVEIQAVVEALSRE